jgi:Cu(I)/Ag(I) efflux system membrane fusion protein
VVFLALPGGRFAPKVVQTAPAPGDRFEVTQGLQQGDQVVTHATFLVDSESRLKAALAAMAGGSAP